MKKYSDIFFDLDHTLWDFERSSAETLQELYVKYKLGELGIPSVDAFISRYQYRNEQMWLQYSFGEIDKDTLRRERFVLTFRDLGVDPVLIPEGIGEEYILLGPRKAYLMPFVPETLDYLAGRYRLHIITNGFDEVQGIKLSSAGLSSYFHTVITSEMAGCRKPDKKIFYYSLEQSGAMLDTSLMIGDTMESDIMGAKGVGMDQVYFNPKNKRHTEKVTFEINCISRLKDFL